jgi:hypothetical protein
MPEGVTLARDEDGAVVVAPAGDSRDERARGVWSVPSSPTWSTGVTDGYAKALELVGVGYRAAPKGTDVELQVGYSHPVLIEAPEGIAFKSPAHPHRGQRHRQGARRPGRRQHPQGPSARALQGQGHQVRGRGHPAQGRARPPGAEPAFPPTSPRPPTIQRCQRGAAARHPAGSWPPSGRASGRPVGVAATRSRSMDPSKKRVARRSRQLRARKRITRHRGEAAAVGVPQQRPHLRPADRRRRRSHPGAASSLESDVTKGTDGKVGVARRSAPRSVSARRKAGITTCVFDRGGNRYAGRVAALAEGAREAGLEF